MTLFYISIWDLSTAFLFKYKHSIPKIIPAKHIHHHQDVILSSDLVLVTPNTFMTPSHLPYTPVQVLYAAVLQESVLDSQMSTQTQGMFRKKKTKTTLQRPNMVYSVFCLFQDSPWSITAETVCTGFQQPLSNEVVNSQGGNQSIIHIRSYVKSRT